jgi:hypothetical protein
VRTRLDIGIACNFLFVASTEAPDFEVSEQAFDLPVRELAALDTGRRPDALDGRHMALRRSGAIVLSARHAPLNSSISERSAKSSWVTTIAFVLSIPANMPDYTGMSSPQAAGLHQIGRARS